MLFLAVLSSIFVYIVINNLLDGNLPTQQCNKNNHFDQQSKEIYLKNASSIQVEKKAMPLRSRKKKKCPVFKLELNCSLSTALPIYYHGETKNEKELTIETTVYKVTLVHFFNTILYFISCLARQIPITCGLLCRLH